MIPCGALKSPPDPDDHVFEHLAQGYRRYIPDQNVDLPVELDLRKYMQPCRDQGARSTCAAFAGAAIREMQVMRECLRHASCELRGGEDSPMLSPEFIYCHRVNKPINGMYGRNVFQILQKIGTVPENLFPYSEAGDTAQHISEELYDEAAQYRIGAFARITTPDGLKHALNEFGPCYLQLPVYSTRPQFWVAADGEPCRGEHATAVVGYTKDGFILKNSWGDDWNGDGLVVFPYADWSRNSECWVGYKIDERDGTHRALAESGGQKNIDTNEHSMQRSPVDTVTSSIDSRECKVL